MASQDEVGSPPQERSSSPGFCTKLLRTVQARHQHVLDSATPYRLVRWLLALLLLAAFAARIVLVRGYYVTAYALSMFWLQQLIGFLRPKVDPVLLELSEEDDDGPELPTKADAEFKPFIRRLPEFKFWYNMVRATLVALFTTLFEVFNVPVFWPILVMYFLLLFYTTMEQQIKHMIRYRYVPFSYGKKRYAGKEDTGKVIVQ